MEALNTNQHPRKKLNPLRIAGVSALVAGITAGGNALAQQNPDAVPIHVGAYVGLKIDETRKSVIDIIQRQDPKDWLIGTAYLGAPLLVAGGLVRRGRRRLEQEIPVFTTGEILETIDAPEILPHTELENVNPLEEAISLKRYGRDIDAIRILCAWIDREDLHYPDGSKVTSPGIEAFRHLLVFLSSSNQINDNSPTPIIGRNKAKIGELPSRRELYEKYFKKLLERKDILDGAKASYYRYGKRIDPENPLYQSDTKANRSTPE